MTNINLVNVENINKVIDLIRLESNYFNMQNYDNTTRDEQGHICKSPSCICGWSNFVIWEGRRSLSAIPYEDETGAAEFLGLSPAVVHDLFCPEAGIDWKRITREEAITTLEILRDTGVVSWKHVWENPDRVWLWAGGNLVTAAESETK